MDRTRGRLLADTAARLSALGGAYQQTQHWLAAGVFEEMVHDLRALPSVSEQIRVKLRGVVQVLALPVTGRLSDRFGRCGIYMLGAVLLGVWSFASWPMVNTESFLLITLALVVGLGFLHH